MAVTSIWRVHGSVGKVLDYVENAEKTTAVSTGDSDLSDVIDYAIQQHKTSQTQVRDGEEVVQRFVSGINCHPSTAGMEMQKVKKFYGKEDGVIAYHGYQSFAPGEATPEIAHEIGVKLARQLWGDRYQVLVATHLDRANHLHSHFVINTVSFVDGIKYHRTKQDYKEMQRVSDALCKEYGLSVIRNPKGRGMTYNEWIAEKEGKPTLRGVIRSDIDRAILASTTQQNFQEAMQAMGYTFKTRAPDGQPLKYPALNPPGAKGYFRFHRLGSGYSLTEILDRVYDNVRRQTPFPEADRMAKQRNPFIPYPKAKGIHALYLRYCYELRMSYSGEAADQVVRLSLNGVEVAAKLSGSAAKQLAIMIYAILKDQKKTKGKIRLTNMLRSGKELKVFAVKDGDLQKFCEEAKKYGVLYCVLKDKNATDGITDIMVRAEDAAKVNRIFTRFGLATVDLASLKTELVKEQDKARTEEDADVRSGSDKPHNDDFVKELFGENPEKHIVEENPQTGRNEAERPSESTLPNRRGEEIFSDSRPSVREAMKQIRQEKAARQPQNTIADKVVEKITKGKER